MATSLPPIYRGLAALHRAGVPWPQALSTAAPEDAAWGRARTRVLQGDTFADSLEGVVPGIDRAWIAAGEAGGRLEQALDALALRHEEQHRRRGQRRTALAYPLLLAHVAALLLPIPDLVQGRPLGALVWALLPLVPLYTFLWFSQRTPRGTGPLPHRFPWTNRVELADAEALEALGVLSDAGVPLLEALPLARQAGARGRAADDLLRAQARVREGLDLAGAWHALPSHVTVGLVSAEHAGSLGAECRAAADRLRFDVEMRTRRSTARLQPLLVLALGMIVGLRVFLFYASAFRHATLR